MGKLKMLFLSILILIISGCGGGDDGSNVEFSPSMNITDMRVVKDNDGNIINLIGKVSFIENETYFSDVTFSDIQASFDGCSVTKTTITPSTLNDNEIGDFNIELASGCKAIYTLTFKGTEKGKYVDTNVKTKTDTFILSKSVIISSDNTTTTDTDTTSSNTTGTTDTATVINTEVNTSALVGSLVVDPQKIDVINSSEQHKLTIQAIDKDGKDVVGGAIIKPLPLVDDKGNVLGYFSQNLYVTDGSGKTEIIYTAPNDVSKLSGEYKMEFFVLQSDINISAIVTFNQNNANVAHLSLIPNDISILEPKMTQKIKIIATDKDFFPVSGANIVFSTMHDDENILGEFDTKSVVTDENGEAIITYTAPDDISNLNTIATALFMLKDNSDVNTTLTARFENGISNLDRIVVNPNNINILSPNQTQEIVVLAIDKDNNPMKNVKIDVESLVDDNNISYGSVDKYQVTTDENGKATIIYTAPQNIEFDNNKSIVFKLDDNNSIQTKVNITFQNQTNIAKIIFDPSSIDVNQANLKQQIKILTVDKDNKPVSALVTLNVPIDENNNSFGSLDVYQVRTNENGEAIVTYTSPTDISKVIGTQEITAEVVNTSVKNSIKVNFNTDKAAYLILDPKSIEVIDGLTKTIRITAFNDNNMTVSGVKLTIKMPVLENGLSVGKFNTYNLITDENGEALIIYTSPDDITMLQGDEYKVEIISENNIKQDLTLKFTKPDSVKYFYVFPTEPVRITQNNQEEEFKIITLDENKRPIQADVLINKLVTEDNTTEFGSMDSYKIETDENGEAVVKYTAPENINTIEGNQTITFRVDNTELEKNVTLVFLEDTNVTQYKITLTKQNSYEVDGIGSFTVNIVKKDNENEYIANGNVIDVNVTTINRLLNFDGNEKYEYNNSASKAIEFNTGIYSGVELVEIKAIINDGDKNITLTNTFNVVISAGEIAAMSINYLGTILNTETGLYEENYAIHAVDKYSNPVKAGTKIYIGAINKAKIYGDSNGTISYNEDINKTEFNTTYDNSKYGVEGQDTLVILANKDRNRETYLGGWHITDINDTNVTLYEKYSYVPVDKLTFVIGNEKRTDICENTVKLIDFDSANHTYEVDENGVAYIKVKYDPYMVGKTVSFYANSLSQTKKVGTSIKKVLKGTEITSTSLADGGDTEDNYIDPLTAHVFKFKLTQNINGREVALQNVKIGTEKVKGLSVLSTEISKSGFSIVCDVSDYRKADLNKVFIKDVDVDTGCDGEVSITIENNDSYYNTYCVVSWNNEIIPEYGADINVTHEEVQTTTPNDKVVKLAIEPESEVISSGGQTQLIKIIAVDSDNKVVANTQINVLALVDKDGKSFGSINNYLITTDSNGEAYVTYTAPNDISSLIGKEKNITFTLENNETTLIVNNTIVFKSGDNNDKVSKIVVDPDSFEVNSPIDTKVLKVIAVDSDGNVVEDAIIDIKALEKDGISYGSVNSYSVVTDSNGEAVVTYYAPENIAKVNGERNITFDVRGTEVESNVSVSFKAKASNINALPRSVVVTQDKQIQEITLVATDNNGNVIPNTKIEAKLNSDYGLLDKYEVITDNNGRANIIYTAPDNVKDLDGKNTEVIFDIDGAEVNTTISFNTNASKDVDHLLVTPTSFEAHNVIDNCTYTDDRCTQKTITIVAINSDNQVVPNAVIKVKELKGSNGVLFGRMSSYSFATDENGEASVTFYSTENDIEGNQTITFDVDGTNVEKNVTVIYPKKASAIAVLPTQIEVTQGSQISDILIVAKDENGKVVPNTRVEIKSLVENDIVYGQMDKYVGYTDENGEIKFVYTAPSDINNLGDKNITIYIPDTNIEKNITVKFYEPAKLALYPTSLTITKANEEKLIKVVVTDKNNRIVPNAKVIIEALVENEDIYGFLNTHTLVTDENGEAVVTYTAPENISNLNEENLTFYIDNTNIESNLTIKFIKPAVSAIVLTPSYFIVEEGKQQAIKVITLADDNTTVASTQVTIDPLFDENGGLVGTFDKYTFMTDENGEAIVTYTPIENINIFEGNKSVKFTTENNKSTRLTLQFIPQKEVSKIVVLPKYVKVTESNQEQEYKIITLDSANRPISANIEINRLLDENDNEYGTLDKYSVTTDANSGEAIVKYTAPDNIDDFDGNYSISFKVNDLEKNTTLEFVKSDSNATEYIVQLVVPNSFAVDAKDSFSVKIVKKSDNDTYIDDKDVNDVNVTFANKMIAFNNDRDEYRYEYNQSASKSIDIYSKTHSGIEFVDVNASIYDGEKNTTISGRFKVVVISGPISAISINYLSTSYDKDSGLFIEKYAIHAVDKYSNPANAGSKIYVGAVNGMKIMKDRNGTIGYNSTNDVTEFNVTDVNLTEANITEDDTLAILANKDRLEGSYLGGWTIKELIDDNQTTLNENYNGKLTDLLSYVIGDEKRYDSCSDSVRLIDFNSTDGNYEVNSQGIAYISAKYDPYLVGKTVTFYANSDSKERVGVAIKRILFGTGIQNPGTLSCEAGENNQKCDLLFGLTLNDSSEDLQNTYLKDTFIKSDSNGECNITYESDYTNCSGSYVVRVSVEKNSTCTVQWSNAIHYEY